MGTAKKKAPCQFCNTNVDADENHCHGCNAVICDDCAVSNPFGFHDPEDHLQEDVSGDEDHYV